MPSTRTSATFTFPSYMEEPIIVYPGAIVCFLQIISAVPKMLDEQVKQKAIGKLCMIIMFCIISIQIVCNIF